MNKKELIDAMAGKMDVSKKSVGDFLEAFTGVVMTTVKKGDDVAVAGFGKFGISHRKARKGINPQNPKEQIDIPAMKLPTFKASSTFKDLLR